MKLHISPLSIGGLRVACEAGDILVDAFIDASHATAPFALGRTRAILVTHDHGDHFSAARTAEAARETGAVVIGPPPVAYALLAGEGLPREQAVSLWFKDPSSEDRADAIDLGGGLAIKAYPSRHFFAGQEYAVHNSYLLLIDGKRVYLGGDSYDLKDDREELRDLDALVVNFVALDKDLAQVGILEDLRDRFRPKVLLPTHLLDCGWTIEPDALEAEVRRRGSEGIRVLKGRGEIYEIA